MLVTEFSVFQDANVKLIRELRDEIGRLKAMLLSFELVCGQSGLFCPQEPLFLFAEDLSPASFYVLSEVTLVGQGQEQR